MKFLNPFLLLGLCFFSASAQTGPFRLAAVPEELKNKASVITHLENRTLEVESLEKATLSVQKIFTVMNEGGKHALLFNEYSSKALSLDDAEIKVYDQNGKQVARYKKKEMTTVAIGEGLIEEGYVTYYEVPALSYPVTVEFNYVQKFKSTLMFPDYRFINTKEAVVESNFTAKLPSELPLRYKNKKNALTPVITEEGKSKIYKWTVKNMAPIEDEEGSVSWRDKLPYVNILTDQFSHYGFKGDISSWKSFGAWINELYKGLDELPTERQQFFKKLVSDAPNEKEKIRRVYQYLQENFRYVSIQLGIGGLRPFSATFTDQKKYGDCKGLSNYMKAALKSVGINSHVAIINAEYNEEPVDADFPANNFNHVILCVPQAKDSVWLECTSNTAEFGKLGTFTENRNALLITDNGGVLVPTPKSEASTNIFSTRTVVNVENDLTAETETIITSKGEFNEMMADMLKEKKDDQKQMIVFYLGYKQPDFFELSSNGASANDETKLKLTIRKLHEFNSGSKYFFNPRINKVWSKKLPSAENRKLDYYFHNPFEKHDTTILKFPAGFTPDILPKEKELNTNYGYYKSKSWYVESENSVYTSTTLILKKHKILAADYNSVKAFFDEVTQDDAQRLVMKKTETNSTPEKKPF